MADLTAAALVSPVRNRYFFGKLLDELHLEMEQDYFIDKRWLLNRFGLGSGVMCGLNVLAAGDNTHVTIDPGVALDGLGREIIVPQRTKPIDPRQLTDDCGKPLRTPVAGAVKVVVGVGYHECDAEPTPSLACECDDDGCQYGAVRERYTVIVQKADDASSRWDCDKVFAPAGGNNRAEVLDARVLRVGRWLSPVRPVSDCPWVPLAIVWVEADGTITSIDFKVRTPVPSNVMLLNLILCLAAELDTCCGGGQPQTHTLTLEALTALQQVMNAGDLAPTPPAVRVLRDGQPAVGESVVWTVGASGGAVSSGGAEAPTLTMQTDTNGDARLTAWRAPPVGGVGSVTAAVAGATPASVRFGAKVEAPVVQEPPRIVAVWPPNGELMASANTALDPARFVPWKRGPFLDLTFDRAMRQSDVDPGTGNMPAWLRVLALDPDLQTGAVASFNPTGTISAIRPLFSFQLPAVAGQTGVTYRYILDGLKVSSPGAGRMVLVMINATGNNIVGDTDGILLDADFDAGLLAPLADPQAPAAPYFDALWDPGTIPAANRPQMVGRVIANAGLTATPLQPEPSGDGTPGGKFHCYFKMGAD